MSMLTISNLSIHFGGRYLFDGVTFTISPRDRIGLIGKNGSGKSTLLKIILGIEQSEDGMVSKPYEYTLGYLPQEAVLQSELSLFDETASAMTEIQDLDLLIDKLNKDIQSRVDYESDEYLKLIQKLSEANERFRILGGLSIEAEIEKILTGLGFSRDDFFKPSNQFSGGWQMRIELAKILLKRPDCILLDEPTNHLDIESIQWLEGFLLNYEGAVVIVSHDRKFLDLVTNRTIEISNSKIFDFFLPYSKFIEQRKELKEQQISAYKQQQKEIAQTEKFIERFRSKATLASRVQSRIKQLDKIDLIEIEEEDISSIKFRFPEPPRSGLLVAETKNLSKSYDSNIILNNINFTIERGEKVAFVGKNGEGKSTLSKILAGEENYQGQLTLGFNVEIGYFAQHQALLFDSDSNPFEVIDNAATGDMRAKVRSLLGAFLFSGESIYKKIKVLSGGEKSRLAIARLLLKPSNFLILDEPTNHLDMMAKDVLKRALIDYQGALIVVSHDREFLDGLTTKTIHFKNSNITQHIGSIYDFLDKMKMDSLAQLEINNKNNIQNKATNSQSQVFRTQQKTNQREYNKIKKEIDKCESEINKVEVRIKEIEVFFATPDFMSDIKKSQIIKIEYDELRINLDTLMQKWTDLNESILS